MVEKTLKQGSKNTVVEVKDKNLKPTAEKQGVYTVQIVRDSYGHVDVTYLNNSDPNFQYRFLRNEQKNLSIKTGNLLYQKGGWQIVPKEHLLEVEMVKDEKELDANGHMLRGDLILAFMPKKLFLEKEAHKKREADAPVNAIERVLEKGDPNVGAGIHESMKGIQTKDNLRGNWK